VVDQQGKALPLRRNYPQAINLVSQHYSKATGQKINVYEITDQVLISEIAHAYSQSGKLRRLRLRTAQSVSSGNQPV
jgi:hypothetical protein